MIGVVLRSNVPRAVRVLRQRAGWRQEDLAAKAGGSRETISRIERGQLRGVTVGALEKVADALGTSLISSCDRRAPSSTG
jgi:transcriptional regulator with XRE-family HTH domain